MNQFSFCESDRQRLGAPHQEHREQRHRRGNRGREQRRRSESIGECRIADLPDARSQRLRHRTDDAHDVARRHVLGEFRRRLGVEPGRDTAGDEAARSNLRQHGTECGDPDQQADKPRRSGEARSHAGALRRDRALHHLRRLTVEQPGAGTGDQHADKKSRIGQGGVRERPQQQVADHGRH